MFLFSTAARPAAADTGQWSEQSERTLPADGIEMVRVENARGFIHVGPSADGRIHLNVLKVMRSPGTEREHRIMEDTRVVLTTEGDRLLVQVRYPASQLRLGFWDMLG